MRLLRQGRWRVLPVMAVDLEYGPALRARIDLLLTGVGPVEAAVALARALARLEASDGLPDLVLSLGSAGSAVLEQGRVYQAGSVAWRDIDASAIGVAPGLVPFLDLPAALPLEPAIPGLPQATLSTGADIVSGTAYQRIDAQMVDMETYALKRAAMAFGVPLIALRGISDGAEELRHVDDWAQALPLIDRRLADALDLTLDALEGLAW